MVFECEPDVFKTHSFIHILVLYLQNCFGFCGGLELSSRGQAPWLFLWESMTWGTCKVVTCQKLDHFYKDILHCIFKIASASGGLRLPDPLPGFALDPLGDFRPPDPLILLSNSTLRSALPQPLPSSSSKFYYLAAPLVL